MFIPKFEINTTMRRTKFAFLIFGTSSIKYISPLLYMYFKTLNVFTSHMTDYLLIFQRILRIGII